MAVIEKLHLENYRNVRDLTIDFNGKTGVIEGPNRIGKTNVLEAVAYLLTDKLLGGSSDVQAIKNKEDTRRRVVVEGVFETEKGEVTLRKEFYEKWVHPRGSSEEELSGHTTDYYINGAKCSRAKDYLDEVSAKFGIMSDYKGLDVYQMLVDPFYLPKVCASKDWKSARKAILSIVGEVEPEEVYAESDVAKQAKKDLEAHQYDDGEAKKAIRGEMDGYKQAISNDEALIAEHDRVQDVAPEDLEDAKRGIEEKNSEIYALQSASDDPFAEETLRLKTQLVEKQKELQDKQEASRTDSNFIELRNAQFKARTTLNDNIRVLDGAKSAARDQQLQRDYLQKQYDELKKQSASLKEDLAAVKKEDVCPTCGQPLPPEKVEAAYNAKVAEIKKKAYDIKMKAGEIKAQIEQCELTGQALESEIKGLQAKVDESQAESDRIAKELEEACKAEEAAAKAAVPDPVITSEIARINKRLGEIESLNSASADERAAKIAEAKKSRDEMQQVVSAHEAYLKARKRIDEIRADKEEKGNALIDAEQRMFAIGEFVKTKLKIMDRHMAAKFGEVRFQLIRENIKAGSYDEVCTPYIVSPETGKATGTLFDSGSMSEQIYTGLLISEAMRNALSLGSLPLLIDQGGELDGNSLSRITAQFPSQIIMVKVVDGDGSIRFETAAE